VSGGETLLETSTGTRASELGTTDRGEVVEARSAGRAGRAGTRKRPERDQTAERRRALARAVVRILNRAVDSSVLDIALADGRVAATSTPVDPAGGVAVMAEQRARARVAINGPDALARLLFPPLLDAFAEGFLRGDLDIDGDVIAAVDAGQALDLRRLDATDVRRLIRWGTALRRGATRAAPIRRTARLAGPRHSRARDLAAIRFHYDVGNEFFGLWLDRRLTYSCAYFPPGTTFGTAADVLDAAQEAKLGLIARKLRLRPGVRLLDIGCGWGSLIGHAAESAGTEAVGVTLSERQAKEANRRLAAAGLADLARAKVLDYRDLGPLGEFDALASVGMFEHVGRANLTVYFQAAFDALRPGGLFLNHGISQARPPRPRLGAGFRPRSSHFVDRYVFPDGELVTVETAISAARAAGFELIDLQPLRPHYALTLAAWVRRLEANWDAAVAMVGEEVARTWRLYMSGARLGFERGDLDVCQLLLAKPDGDGPARLPLQPWW
jgi:cyclopropane-fatty-acyl-phospholipid synthase